MSIATLEDIITKVRRLTGSATSNQLTDAQIIDYINSFYLYDFPAQFRSLKLKDKYTFNTIRGIDTYPFDSEHYTTIEMPCYVAKREVQLFQDPWSFYGVWFNWQFQETLAQGDGTTGQVTGDITNVFLVATDPVRIISVGHELETGDVVRITEVVGTTELNLNTYTITVINSSDFDLDGTDSSLFTPYVSGGQWSHGSYEGTCTSHPIIRSTRNNPMVETKTVPTVDFTVLPEATTSPFPQANIGRVQNLLITANVSYGTTLNVTDDGAGNLIGDCVSGLIDYDTGEVTNLIFSQAVPAGADITIEYNPASPGNLAIPQAIMFFQNQFTMRPVPDKGYTVELIAYRLPSQALLGTTTIVDDEIIYTGTPELKEWWETLAFGAAKKVYEDRLDPDGVALMDKSLAERYDLNETRTYAQLGKQSMNSMFRDQLQQNYGASGWGWGTGA